MSKWRQRCGFALISALLILAVLTIMAVGFLSAIRLERQTSRSYLQLAKAKLAAESGWQVCRQRMKAQLDQSPAGIVTSGFFTPTTTPLPYASFLSGHNTEVLISGPVTDRVIVPPTGVDLNHGRAGFIQNILTMDTTSTNTSDYYRVPWEYLTVNEVNNSRFAYLVMDEHARLNPTLHQGNTRSWGADPKEIPLAQALNLTSDQARNLLNLVPFIFTNLSMGQAFPNYDTFDQVRHLLTTQAEQDIDIIPEGYPEAGKPKYNINDLATSPDYGNTARARAENIARIIDRNLPQFKERDRSLAVADRSKYLNRLAAGIIDYIDTDTQSTIVNDGEPAGRDLSPLVTAVVEKYSWDSAASSQGHNHYDLFFTIRAFVQVWNPYTTSVQGTAGLRINDESLKNNFYSKPLFYNQINPQSYTLRPNEFIVIPFDISTDSVGVIGNPQADPELQPGWDYTTDNPFPLYPRFQFYWNGELVDGNRYDPTMDEEGNLTGIQAGLEKKSFNVGGGGFPAHTIHWSANFIPTWQGGKGYRSVGDPRINYLCSYEWNEITDLRKTRWFGIQTNTSPRTQDYVTSWAKRDYVRANPTTGSAPAGAAQDPDQVTPPVYTEANGKNAPCYIRNAPMQSIGELGHIFDPAQVDDTGDSPAGGTPASPYISGGGRTLCIGQPEITGLWDKPGMRAMELLDLFTVNARGVQGFPGLPGRININTASLPVLTALLQDIIVHTDEGIAPATLRADMMAQEIIKYRPYLKISDLYKVLPKFVDGASYEPSFNNSVDNKALVMDRAREEAFARFINLVTLHSRAFRIYVVGQSLNPQGRAEASLYKEIMVKFVPKLNGVPPDTTTTYIPVVTFQRTED